MAGSYCDGGEISLTDFENCITSRLKLYEYVSGRYAGAPYESDSQMQRLLRLDDAQSVQLDRHGYTMVLMFVISLQHSMSNPVENAAFASAWHRAEEKLFNYRITHFSQSNIMALISLVSFSVDRVTCNDVYSKLKGDNDDSKEYNECLRAFFPVGSDSRYAVPFEAVPSLVKDRLVFLNAGRAYLSDDQLFHIITHEAVKVHTDNMAARIRTRSGDGGEPWYSDERTRSIYKRVFVPSYIHVIRHYGIGSLERHMTAHVDDSVHEARLEAVLHASPPCFNPLLSRGTNLKEREHNKNMDRQDTTSYLLRMGIPARIFKVKLQIKAERDALVDSSASPWNTLQSSVAYQSKKYNNGVSNVFKPACWWIAKGDSKSTLRCPFAEKIKATMPVGDWPHKLADASRAECHKHWQKEAKAAPTVHRFPASTPEEYTERLMAQRGETDVVVPTQVKRKVS